MIKWSQRRSLAVGASCALFFAQNCMAQSNITNEAARLESQGRFNQAAQLLARALNEKTISPTERTTLEFELVRLERIKYDYSLTREGLFEALKHSLKGLTPKEYEKWLAAGWFDGREIDGTAYFAAPSVSNLYFRHPELNDRRIKPLNQANREHGTLEIARAIKKAALAEKTHYVLPRRFRATMAVTAQNNAVPAGDTIRAWIPIPRRYPFQDDFKLLSTSWPAKSIDDETSPSRSIYFEQPAARDRPTEFKIEYEFTTRGVFFGPKPEEIKPYDLNDPVVKEFTRERPHIVFTPEIKALSKKIVGSETNPCLKAKKIYDWLADHMLYSYALEYSTSRNLSDYCRAKGYGDCGQQALLFMTLCRYNGIPARWESGWNLFPGYTSNHDWTEIYLAPYGWMPVDPYMGNYAMHYAPTLTPEEKIEIRDFYFGGLDQYRMAANSDHNQPLNPPKQSFRSDDVDFQRGELECRGTNIYFDKFSYKFEWKEAGFPQ